MTDDLHARLDRGQERFRMIDDNMREILREVQQMRADLHATIIEVEKMREIVVAWQSVKAGARFTKFAAGLIVVVGGAIGAIKGWLIK